MTDLSIPFLEQQESELVLPSFDLTTSWTLGRLIVERALETGAGVAVDIRRGDHVLFRAMLPGTTIDQQDWIRKKAAVVHRFEASSALVALRLADVDVKGRGWLDARDYALTGGSFPIRVAGTGVVGAVSASGLTSEEDHTLVTDGIREYLRSVGRG